MASAQARRVPAARRERRHPLNLRETVPDTAVPDGSRLGITAPRSRTQENEMAAYESQGGERQSDASELEFTTDLAPEVGAELKHDGELAIPVDGLNSETTLRWDDTHRDECDGEYLSTETHPVAVGVDISTELEFHTAPQDAGTVMHALVDLQPSGPSLVAPEEGPVAHVVLALDLSASMNTPDKYPVLTRAIEGMLHDLHASRDGDVLLSLVVFAYGAETVFRAIPASELTARDVLAWIDHSPLRFGRYTDIVGALDRAGRIAYDSHAVDRRLPVRLYLLTDGKPQDMDGAREKMALLSRLPVDINALAFGMDADVQALQQLIAGGRGGTVKHVRSETLHDAFGRIAEVARRVVAKRALVDVELAPGLVGGAVYRFRPGRYAYGDDAFGVGRSFSTDLGTLESSRRYSLLIQFRLPASEERVSDIGRVTVRVPGEGGAQVFENVIRIPRHPGDPLPTPNAIVREAVTIVEGMDHQNSAKTLESLRARRRIYIAERRDPYLIALLDRAIDEVESRGSLDALTDGERAALMAHTHTSNPDAAPVAQKRRAVAADAAK